MELNASAPKSDIKFDTKCITKNINKKNADSAMENFLPMEERNKDSCAIKLKIDFDKKTNLEKLKSFNNE